MASVIRNVAFQPETLAAAQSHAEATGVTFSALVDAALRKSLPKEIRDTLPKKTGRGRPKKY